MKLPNYKINDQLISKNGTGIQIGIVDNISIDRGADDDYHYAYDIAGVYCPEENIVAVYSERSGLWRSTEKREFVSELPLE